MNNITINTLFYSRKCKTCQDLYILLKNYNLIKLFNCISVDNLKDYSFLKKNNITMVPTIIVPSQNKFYKGSETFTYINELNFFNNSKHNIIKKNISNKYEYVQEEMNGISDSYAYTKYDNPQPKSFEYNNTDKKNIIFTAPELKNKLTEDYQKKLVKEQEHIRSIQDDQLKEIAKNEQIKTYLLEDQRKLIEEQERIRKDPNLKYNKKYKHLLD
tara:strand:+ start:18 stop:662 length:645 start_codon:yes stop_codon:yes gene_type:complete